MCGRLHVVTCKGAIMEMSTLGSGGEALPAGGVLIEYKSLKARPLRLCEHGFVKFLKYFVPLKIIVHKLYERRGNYNNQHH